MSFSLESGFSDPNLALGTGFFGDVFDATGSKNKANKDAAIKGLQDWKPTGFSTSGLSGSFADGQFNITRSDELQSSLGGLQSALSQRALEFANLRKGLRRDAGSLIGGLKESGIQGIQDKRRRAVGDLRENLASRRIAGSSFASDAVTRAEAEFAKEEAQFGAEADIKQFEMEQQVLGKEMELLDQETQANIQGFQSNLTQLNLEAGLAAQISTAMSSIAAENQRAIAEIMMQYDAARANMVGTVGGGILSGIMSSDRRVKKDIKEVGRIGPLPVYTFKYILDEKDQIGFMAQDVEEIFPDCVINDDIKYIDYSKLRVRLCH